MKVSRSGGAEGGRVSTTGLRLEQCQCLGNQKVASRARMWWRKGWGDAEGVTQGLKSSSF